MTPLVLFTVPPQHVTGRPESDLDTDRGLRVEGSDTSPAVGDKPGTRQGHLLSPPLFPIVLRVRLGKKRRKRKAKGLGRKEVKEEFPGDTVGYTGNLKESTDMSLKPRCDFRKVADQVPSQV